VKKEVGREKKRKVKLEKKKQTAGWLKRATDLCNSEKSFLTPHRGEKDKNRSVRDWAGVKKEKSKVSEFVQSVCPL